MSDVFLLCGHPFSEGVVVEFCQEKRKEIDRFICTFHCGVPQSGLKGGAVGGVRWLSLLGKQTLQYLFTL